MANGIVATAAEYLVKLGVSLDYSNMQKLEKFLDSSAFKAAKLGAALVAGSTAIYKFMKSMTSVEMEYVNLAREQQKSIENVRAEQNALKAMGKTAVEVAKDPALKKIQNDLVEIGKGMQLPDLTKPLESVRALQKEFYALKMTLQYALQWLNYYLLQDLRSTIERITAWFQKIREWVQTRLKPFTRRLATFLGDFVRGVEGILRIVDKIFDFINRLPASIKTFGVTFAAVLTALNAGPLGKMLMILTAIGDLIKDYENFMFNKSKGVTGAVGQELYGNVGKYFDEEGRLSAAGKQFLESNGIDPSGVVNVAFDTLWGPISEGDWLTALGNVFQPMLDALNKLFTEDIPALLNGETSIVGLIVSKLNGTTEESFGEGEENSLSPFGRALSGGIIAAVGAYFTTNVLQGFVDNLFGEGTFKGIGIYFAGRFIGDITDSLSDLSYANGKFNNDVIQGIADLIQTVFNVDLGQLLQNAGIMDANGNLTADAVGVMDAVGDWGPVIGRFISQKMTPIAQYIDLGKNLLDSETGLIAQLANVFTDLDGRLSETDVSSLTSTVSATLGNIFHMMNLDLFAAIADVFSEEGTRNQFLSLLLGELVPNDADMAEFKYEAFGARFAGGGILDKILDWIIGTPTGNISKELVTRIFPDDLGGEIERQFVKVTDERGEDGLWPRIKKWLFGYDETDASGNTTHIEGIFEKLWNNILAGAANLKDDLIAIFQAIGDWLAPYVDYLIYKIERALRNSGLGGALEFVGLLGEEREKFVVGDDGKYHTISEYEAMGKSPREIAEALALANNAGINSQYGGYQVNDSRNGLQFYVPAKISPEATETFNALSDAYQNALYIGDDEAARKILSLYDTLFHEIEVMERVTSKYGINDINQYLQDFLQQDQIQYIIGTLLRRKQNLDAEIQESHERSVEYNQSLADGTVEEKYPELSLADFKNSFVGVNADYYNRLLWLRENGVGVFGEENLALISELIQLASLDKHHVPGYDFDTDIVAKQIQDLSILYRTITGNDAGFVPDNTWFNYSTGLYEEGNEDFSLEDLGFEVDEDGNIIGKKMNVSVDAKADADQIETELNKRGPYSVDIRGSSSGDDDDKYSAWGGRFGEDTLTHVGEDGPEYIIPISKPQRAMSLIMRMFREMGGNALRKVVEGFGLNGGADTIGGSLSSLGVPNASISIVNNVNVTNTILVQGGDRSASEIGLAAYDASERYLLRTLQGVLA